MDATIVLENSGLIATAPSGVKSTISLREPIPLVCLSSVQKAAFEYYAAGLSIGPTKPGTKQAFLYKRLAATRIALEYIPELFDNGAGIFVMTGRISRNLASLDCETEKTAEYHAAEFARRGLKPWCMATSRGCQFWWLSADGELANVPDIGDTLRHWEVFGSFHYVMAPPSVHPDGVIYEWEDRQGELPPVIPISALGWLPLKLRSATRRSIEPRAFSALDCLSRATREFIELGAPEGSRNHRLFKAACDMAGNEFDYETARSILAAAAARCGLGRSEIRYTINSAFSEPRQPAKRGRVTPPMPTWLRIAQWAEAQHWKPLSATVERVNRQTRRPIQVHYAVRGQTARAVFLACCERSRLDQSNVFRASAREVAEIANVRAMTACKALVCLTEAGFLRRCGYSDLQCALFTFGERVAKARQ